ncbi:MAG TPA: phospholipase D-like domain-containing protein [Caldimonas sp.]|nr:phospholipase D-like domain-containing protein [Caldimonas sp.]HEX4234377.1 phospholipase D-like domain-containing protein [Caldimonas sp.]
MKFVRLRQRLSRKSLIMAVIVACIVTLAIALIAVNASSGEKKIQQRIEHLYGVEDPEFLHVMGVLLGPPVVSGNRYQVLVNGDRIFPSMLQAIRGAKQTIDFETYIYWSGAIGKEFADALAERARAGVRVHVLLDWVGSQKMEDALLDELKSAGVEIQKYHPPHWSQLGRLNNRTHRKLLVVDGTIGFTGGVGVAEQWTGDAQDPEHWRDTHFRVEGPVVAQMQGVFMDNWIKTAGAVLHSAGYFPPIAPLAGGPAQVFSSSPSGGSASMELMYLLAITSANRTIRLSSSYFVPNEMAVKSMVAAMKRGVKLQIIVPGKHIDTETVRSASKARWGDLLAAGAEIYEYQPTMYHCKVMIVDEYLVSTGSTNFDDRSFRLNDEANLNLYDAAFAAEQVRIFAADLARSRRVTLAEWQQRPLKDKLLEKLASLLGPQL